MLAAFKEIERKRKEQGVECRTETEHDFGRINIFQNQEEAAVLTL